MKKNFLLILLSIFAFQSKAQTYLESITQHRETYKNEFLKDEEGPVKKEDFSYFDFYEPDTSYRVKCAFKVKKEPKTFKIPTVDGKQKEYFKYGILSFEVKGKKLILNVYRSLSLMNNPKYRNYLFIPFKDQTNGKETYGGGRYLDMQTTDIQGDSVILDFNKAYNPYCAFSSGYSCPIPPKENHLKVRVEAGEKNFKKAH